MCTLARSPSRFGDRPAGGEAADGQRDATAAARHHEFDLRTLTRHNEAALRSTHLDRRIQHQRQQVVERTAGGVCTQPLEQHRYLVTNAKLLSFYGFRLDAIE
jgi:hypothetical protein